MTITEKVEQEHFDHIVAGNRRDIELNADPIQEGDTLILEEWDSKTNKYTDRKIETVVTAVSPLPTDAQRVTREHAGKKLQLIQFELKESKYTPSS
jgi:uncharacterized protein DUF3850